MRRACRCAACGNASLLRARSETTVTQARLEGDTLHIRVNRDPSGLHPQTTLVLADPGVSADVRVVGAAGERLDTGTNR